ncbi:hypothetical protein ACFPTX_04485 [Pseudomonas sp. GCM10022188]|uniref:hypothetical protein n=1 Tax=Pseudomonas TaxID=286 RepID=UPI001E60AD37|nr:hypothetical protein [Pseudomonas oryzagri]MCC6076939.1 hypothetical protein [Pseudomonas oryzagri]
MRSILEIALISTILLLMIYVCYKQKIEPGTHQKHIPANLMIIYSGTIVAIIIATFITTQLEEIEINGDIGQVGDFVGGLLNPIFSFMALIVLLRTTKIQIQEIQKSSEALLQQKEVTEREKFENTFFKLIDRFEDFCTQYTRAVINDDGTTRAVFIRGQIKEISQLIQPQEPTKEQVKKIKKEIDKLFHKSLDNNISFMRRGFLALYFIDDSKLKPNEKEFYARYFFDSFAKNERYIFIMFAYAIGTRSKALTRKYGIGENIKPALYISEHIEKYFTTKKILPPKK